MGQVGEADCVGDLGNGNIGSGKVELSSASKQALLQHVTREVLSRSGNHVCKVRGAMRTLLSDRRQVECRIVGGGVTSAQIEANSAWRIVGRRF